MASTWVIMITLTLFSACDAIGGGNGKNAVDSYFLAGSRADRALLRDLFSLLESETVPGEEQFSVVKEISKELLRLKEYRRLANFLSGWVARHPDDPYNAYFLFMCAHIYLRQNAGPVAALYLDRIVKNYPDLMVRGESIHLASLKKLIDLVDREDQRVWYYQELISRFSDRVDLGVTYFMLAQSYERIGEWESAIKTYMKFLPYYSSSIPGFPDAFRYAKNLTDLHNSTKDWTFESLDSLVRAVKAALDMGSSVRLGRYRARVNFFARTWGQGDTDAAGSAEFNLSDFMTGNRIHYAPTLDAGSNANEAYLRTWGWSQWISTWYLYFRKIHFPADPEIHGRWEWAGVFYGEKF